MTPPSEITHHRPQDGDRGYTFPPGSGRDAVPGVPEIRGLGHELTTESGVQSVDARPKAGQGLSRPGKIARLLYALRDGGDPSRCRAEGNSQGVTSDRAGVVLALPKGALLLAVLGSGVAGLPKLGFDGFDRSYVCFRSA
jgi:hypothetical protein